ncbi:MAG: hypothetical protein V3T57_03280 [Kiloniellales bacterium]
MMLPLTPDDGVTEVTESGALEAPRAERWGNHHPVNIRLSIPFFTRRYYLMVIGGTEQRSTERLAEDREKHPLTTTANMIFLFTVGFILGGSCWIGLQAMATWLWRVAVT